jgi:hypothetical protein
MKRFITGQDSTQGTKEAEELSAAIDTLTVKV